jgi:hypothetical protein
MNRWLLPGIQSQGGVAAMSAKPGDVRSDSLTSDAVLGGSFL